MGNRRPETEDGLGLDEKSLLAAQIEVRAKRLRKLAQRVNHIGGSKKVIDKAVRELLSDVDIIPGEIRFNVEYLDSVFGGEN